MPTEPSPINIELFVERQFGFSYSFGRLNPGTSGVIAFSPIGPKSIVVNKKLDRPRSVIANRRCRETLAHECGHGLLHAYYFAELWKMANVCRKLGPDHLYRFEDERKNFVVFNKAKRLEWQANRAMGALLIPRTLFEMTLRRSDFKNARLDQLSDFEERTLISHISLRFDVNRTTAYRRVVALKGLYKSDYIRQQALSADIVALRDLLPLPQRLNQTNSALKVRRKR